MGPSPHPQVLSPVERILGQMLFALLRASDARPILLILSGQLHKLPTSLRKS